MEPWPLSRGHRRDGLPDDKERQTNVRDHTLWQDGEAD